VAQAADAAVVAINARAAIRAEIGGVERLAREMARRLPALRPDRYRVIRPPAGLAHRAGHAWEQAVLPALAGGAAALYSPANLAPVRFRRNVLVIHDVAALRHPEAYSRPYVEYQRRLLPRLARDASALITVSEFSRGDLIEVLGASAERVTVIPEGVDGRFFADPDPRAAAARYELAGPYALAVGTMSARKNLHVLDHAARALAGRGVELVLAGSDRGYLRGSQAGLRRLGYVDEAYLPGLYAGAVALAMPSGYEGFGLPCLEAMAAGTPVVAASAGALPETCGDAALLVEPSDAGGFADALMAAASDEQVRTRLIEAGRRRAAEFSWARTAKLTDALIGEVIGEGGSPGPGSNLGTG
jgi:glycosyltransferase involved in cell wall biosynthesis